MATIQMNFTMSQDEFNAILDARLETKNPALAAANRQLSDFRGNLEIIKASSETKKCNNCGETKAIIEFPPIYKDYNPDIFVAHQVNRHCYDCEYADALIKLKFYHQNFSKNPVHSWAYDIKRECFEHGWIKFGTCFCGEPAAHWHHPSYSRPHEGIGYCEKHHDELHNVIDELYMIHAFVPFHRKKRYFDKIGRKGKVYVVWDFYAEEIINQPAPVLIREREHQEGKANREKVLSGCRPANKSRKPKKKQ